MGYRHRRVALVGQSGVNAKHLQLRARAKVAPAQEGANWWKRSYPPINLKQKHGFSSVNNTPPELIFEGGIR